MTKGTSANHKRDVGQPLQHEQKQVIVGLDPTIFPLSKKLFILEAMEIRRSSRPITKGTSANHSSMNKNKSLSDLI
jgi:hypothetical protein